MFIMDRGSKRCDSLSMNPHIFLMTVGSTQLVSGASRRWGLALDNNVAARKDNQKFRTVFLAFEL